MSGCREPTPAGLLAPQDQPDPVSSSLPSQLSGAPEDVKLHSDPFRTPLQPAPSPPPLYFLNPPLGQPQRGPEGRGRYGHTSICHQRCTRHVRARVSPTLWKTRLRPRAAGLAPGAAPPGSRHRHRDGVTRAQGCFVPRVIAGAGRGADRPISVQPLRAKRPFPSSRAGPASLQFPVPQTRSAGRTVRPA